MAQVWLRDPWNYIREVVEANHPYVLWRPGTLRAKNINPIVSAELYFANRPWEVLVSGTQGATHYKAHTQQGVPVGVYPVFSLNDKVEHLEELLNNPVGDSKRICSDTDIAPELRPVYGQEHRVFVRDFPNLSSPEGKGSLAYVNDIQKAFPEAVIHVCGLNTFASMFAAHITSADYNPRDRAARGALDGPSGGQYPPDKIPRFYLNLIGMTEKQLQIPRNRCIFNIKSAVWASQHYKEEVQYRIRNRKQEGTEDMVDDDLKIIEPEKPPVTKGYLVKRIPPRPGDKFQCNLCSLQSVCKLYREGSVCVVPGAEPKRLAEFFGTRDSDQIINGLSILVQGQMTRVEKALHDEAARDKGMDPEVSKEITNAFTNGVKLAQLVDPGLRPGAKIQINNNLNTQTREQVANANPTQLVSQVIRELELNGINREDITSEMLEDALSAMAARPKAIDQR